MVSHVTYDGICSPRMLTNCSATHSSSSSSHRHRKDINRSKSRHSQWFCPSTRRGSSYMSNGPEDTYMRTVEIGQRLRFISSPFNCCRERVNCMHIEFSVGPTVEVSFLDLLSRVLWEINVCCNSGPVLQTAVFAPGEVMLDDERQTKIKQPRSIPSKNFYLDIWAPALTKIFRCTLEKQLSQHHGIHHHNISTTSGKNRFLYQRHRHYCYRRRQYY